MNAYIRRATLADKEGVSRIYDNLYGGRDYLNSYYDTLLSQEISSAYVGVCDGRIVSFSLFTVVDGGRAMVSRAGRTNVRYPGRGYMQQMREAFWLDHPNIVQTFASLNTGRSIHRPDVNIIITKALYRFEPFRISEFQGHVPATSLQLNNVNNSTWEMYMSEERFREYLFPKGRVTIDRVPFQVIPSNIPLLSQTGGTHLALSDVCVEDGDIKGLLTVSICYDNGSQTCINIDIFGTAMTSLKQHLIAHVNFGTSRFPDQPVISLMIDCEESIDSDELRKIMRQLGVAPVTWKEDNGDVITTRVYCERNNPALKSKF